MGVGGGFQSPEHYRAASMTAVALIVAALLLGHDISKAIDRMTDAIERKEKENHEHTTQSTAACRCI